MLNNKFNIIIIIGENGDYPSTLDIFISYIVYNIPKDFGGSDRTQSAEEHNRPCCIKTMGLGLPTLKVDSAFPWGIRCIVRI